MIRPNSTLPATPTPMLTAAERLNLSRERLRRALLEPKPAPSDSNVTGQHVSGHIILDRLKAIPGANIVIEAVSSWWLQHPMRVASMVAADAAKTVVQPIARRNPMGLVVCALLAGGLFTWSRPWRWILKPALFAGLVPQLFNKAMAHVPMQSWMTVLTTLSREQRHSSSTPHKSSVQGEPTHPEQVH